jgi:D-galactarolactone isomerase
MSAINTPASSLCDCHVHVFDPTYPMAPSATYVPPVARVESLQAMHQSLGIGRVVVVQPTGYGFDNRCTMAAVATLGSSARAVVTVNTSVGDVDLQVLHEGGARGVRFMMAGGGVLPWDALESLAARIQPLGWHINLQLNGCELPQYADCLKRLPVAVVVDHIGKFMPPPGAGAPSFRALRTLMDGGRCWVKLSAPYESSLSGPPAYEDVSLLARELARDYAERCLWASNWPHPNRQPVPDNAALLEQLQSWAPSSAAAQRILVDNPQTLYGF